MEISATFRVDASTSATRFGLKVRVAGDEATTIGYNRQQLRLYLIAVTPAGRCQDLARRRWWRYARATTSSSSISW